MKTVTKSVHGKANKIVEMSFIGLGYMWCGPTYVTMVIADVLTPNRQQGNSNYHADSITPVRFISYIIYTGYCNLYLNYIRRGLPTSPNVFVWLPCDIYVTYWSWLPFGFFVIVGLTSSRRKLVNYWLQTCDVTCVRFIPILLIIILLMVISLKWLANGLCHCRQGCPRWH